MDLHLYNFLYSSLTNVKRIILLDIMTEVFLINVSTILYINARDINIIRKIVACWVGDIKTRYT